MRNHLVDFHGRIENRYQLALDGDARVTVNNLTSSIPREGVQPMLVLSRQRDESIIIGDNIVITVVDIRGDKVRLGIDAPKEIPVHRQEVYDAIQKENSRAQVDQPQVERTKNAP